MSISVVVAGARRVRQGIGEHVARFLHRHGAQLRAVVGTSAATADDARRNLKERHGIECRAYGSLAAALDGERPDALAICTPHEAHEAALETAVARGLHVLSDKPLILPRGGGSVAAKVRTLAARAAERGKLVTAITQWPCTLGAFRRLYPEIDLKSLERLEMRLSPTLRGPAMLVDSLPHPVSLLRALAGPGRVRGARQEWRGDEAVTVRFGWEPEGGRTVDAIVRLERCEAQPRPASYVLNGLEAHREVRMADYSMELRAPDGRRVPLEDPLDAFVRDWLARVARGERADAARLESEARALEDLLTEVSK